MPKRDCNNFIVITLRHGCSPVNLLHIFRTPLLQNTSERLLLFISITRTKIFQAKTTFQLNVKFYSKALTLPFEIFF